MQPIPPFAHVGWLGGHESWRQWFMSSGVSLVVSRAEVFTNADVTRSNLVRIVCTGYERCQL